MTRRLAILFSFGCIFVFTVNCQEAAQGAGNFVDGAWQAKNPQYTRNETAGLEQLIKDVFGPSDTSSTSSPNNGGAPGTTSSDLDQLIKNIFESPDTSSTSSPNNGGAPGTRNCTCVPYYLCNKGSIDTNGEGTSDSRINHDHCESYLEVCCSEEEQAPPEKQTGCGFRNPEGVGFRITGDNEHETQFGEFPWMVAVLREETVEGNPNNLNVYQCGGALIHPQVVVTAAHCVSGKNKSFLIRAGEWDTQHTQELYPHQDRHVQNIIIHPQYYAGTGHNDVAVLYLKTPVNIAENVETICLPPQGTSILNSTTCYATGWGNAVFGQKGKYEGILNKIELPVVPNEECQTKLRTTRLGTSYQLHKSFMCAGGAPGKDICKVDGGSPLVCPIPGKRDRYYQIGIIAWGVGCGETNILSVYVNLPLFREWIDTQVKSFGFDAFYYQY